MNGPATAHFALVDLAVCGAGRLASLTLAPSAARPSPPRITGNLAIRSVSVVSPTAHNAMYYHVATLQRCLAAANFDTQHVPFTLAWW